MEVGVNKEEKAHSEEEVTGLLVSWEENGAKMSLEFLVCLAERVFSD